METTDTFEDNDPQEEEQWVNSILSAEEPEAAPVEKQTEPEPGDEAQPEEEKASTEDEAQPEESDVPEKPDLYTVKVKGVEKQVTLEELKRDYSGQAYIQQQMQEAAEQKKQAAQFLQTLQAEQQRVIALAQQLQQQGAVPAPQPPDPGLAEKDPVAYIKALATFTKQSQAYAAQQTHLQALQQQRAQMTAAQRQAEIQAQAERLKAAIPEFADPQKAEAKRSEVLKAGTEYGFADAELMGITDARMVQVLHDAAQYRKLKANPATPVKEAGKVVKPTAQRSEPSQLSRSKLIAKATKTQSPDDWVNALLIPKT